MFWYKSTLQLHSKAIVTFKRGWNKLYYTQYTFLSNMRQLLFFFFLETNTHTKERERDDLSFVWEQIISLILDNGLC